jgi:hypothetical protein
MSSARLIGGEKDTYGMKAVGSESRALYLFRLSAGGLGGATAVLSIAGREDPGFGMPSADLRGGWGLGGLTRVRYGAGGEGGLIYRTLPCLREQPGLLQFTFTMHILS